MSKFEEVAKAYIASLPPLVPDQQVKFIDEWTAEGGEPSIPAGTVTTVVDMIDPYGVIVRLPGDLAFITIDRADLMPVVRFIDYRGHNGRQIGELIDVAAVEDTWERSCYERIVEEAEREHARSMSLGFRLGMDRTTCCECAKSFTLEIEGDRVVASTVCAMPGGLPVYDVLLNVPSGEMVFANDLRPLILCDDPEGPDVNSRLGCKLVTQAYAGHGMVHISVGNTCPGVHREPDGSLVVARRYAEEEDEDGEPIPDAIYKAREAEIEANQVASICTDLWWFSAMDYDWFVRRCEAEGEDPNDFDFTIVVVEPGVYAFSDEMPRDRDENGAVFSRVRRVDLPPPAITDGEEPAPTSLEASRIWRELQKGYFGRSGLNTLEYLLFTLGNGRRWVRGNLRNIHRSDDPSYLDSVVPGGRWSGSLQRYRPRKRQPHNLVPVFPRFDVKVYPLSWTSAGQIAYAPFEVDRYTLVLGLMSVKSALANQASLDGFTQAKTEAAKAKAVARQIVVLQKTLDLLCEIASRRGLFRSGEVRRIGAEVLARFDTVLDPPREKPKTPDWLDALAEE